jgi:hypothetical protein
MIATVSPVIMTIKKICCCRRKLTGSIKCRIRARSAITETPIIASQASGARPGHMMDHMPVLSSCFAQVIGVPVLEIAEFLLISALTYFVFLPISGLIQQRATQASPPNSTPLPPLRDWYDSRDLHGAAQASPPNSTPLTPLRDWYDSTTLLVLIRSALQANWQKRLFGSQCKGNQLATRPE